MFEKNKEIVGKVNASLAAGNPEGFLSFCADDVQWTIAGEKSVQGKENIRQWMNQMAAENPAPPKFTVDNVFGEGEFVAATGNMSMKDKDGKEGQYTFCDIYRFENDTIIELNSYVVKTEAKHKTTSGA